MFTVTLEEPCSVEKFLEQYDKYDEGSWAFFQWMYLSSLRSWRSHQAYHFIDSAVPHLIEESNNPNTPLHGRALALMFLQSGGQFEPQDSITLWPSFRECRDMEQCLPFLDVLLANEPRGGWSSPVFGDDDLSYCQTLLQQMLRLVPRPIVSQEAWPHAVRGQDLSKNQRVFYDHVMQYHGLESDSK
jgi:hypothetical protein